MKQKFNVEGMTCAACQSHVKKSVDSINGVSKCEVNLLKNNMVVEYDNSVVSSDTIINSVNKAGYKAYLSEKKTTTVEADNKLISLIISLAILALLMYVSMGHMINLPLPRAISMANPVGFAFTQFLMVLIIVYLNRNYFINGFKRLFKLSPNMDSLIAIGALASLIYGIISIYLLSLGYNEYLHNLYFESAGMILSLVSLGKYLEHISKKKTTKALEDLTKLKPTTATILIDNIEKEVDVDTIKIDDIVIVKNGYNIPIDGIIIEGGISVDESNITGESLPVYKGINSAVYSSTIVTAGYAKIKTTKTVEDTMFSNIIRLVDEASNSKAPISKLADKISGVFVPAILGIAILTFILNYILHNDLELAFRFAITVIVIACPCALGLATPVAVMVSAGKASQGGILIKNAEMLEHTSKIKTVVFDKTGTLTVGKPKVISVKNFSDDNLYSEIYALELMSEHPLANAICNYLSKYTNEKLNVTSYEAILGVGIKGIIDNSEYYIGNTSFITDPEILKYIDSITSIGATPIAVMKNNKLVHIFNIKDEIKEDARVTIDELEKLGIKTIMLTGDNLKTATSIAKELGITDVIAEVTPKDKSNVLKKLTNSSNGLVAMVGDGVNDSIALANADIAITVGNASDVAINSSDIVLLHNNLIDIKNSIMLSRRTLNTIKLNLFWAFFYNFICVIIATGIFYPYLSINPMIGSIAMSISSVCVVTSSLTINLFKPMKTNKEKGGNIMKTEIIYVEGMMCKHCKAHVEKACMSVSGVVSAEASLEQKNVTVSCSDEVLREALVNAIAEAGYEIK